MVKCVRTNFLFYEKSFKVNYLYKITIIFMFFLCQIFHATFGQNTTNDSISIAINAVSGKKKANLLLFFSRQYRYVEPEKCLDFARQAEAIARQEDLGECVSGALKLQGDALFELDSLPGSLESYLKSLEAEEALSEPRTDTLAYRLSDVGFIYNELGFFDLGLEYHRRALEINIQISDSSEIPVNYINIGVCYKMTGQYGEAIGAFNEAMKIDKMLGNEPDIAIDLNNIGTVYQAWGKHLEAIRFFQMAYDIDARLGNKAKFSIRFSNIAQSFMEINNIPEAISYFEKALEIDRELNTTVKIPVRLQGLGVAYSKLGQFSKALSFFDEALGRFESLGHESRIAVLHYHFGELYSNMGSSENVVLHFQKSLEYARKLGMKPTIIDAAKGLYHFYKNHDEYKEALTYFEIYKNAVDSVFSENSSRQINEFEIRYETEKKENENRLLTKDLQIKERNQWFLITLVVGLILLSGSLFYAFRLKKRSLIQSKILFEQENELNKLKITQVEKENLHLQEVLFAEEEIKKLQAKSIEQKNHELTSATLLIANKNEAFENLRRMAEYLTQNNAGNKDEKFREIIREIDRQTDVESQWEQFRMHFESIHKSFFIKLRETNTGLTQTDLQLCAYIKLNMGTKEIARLMNITPESVNTHRYRLRKKITMKADETLDEFVHRL